MARKMSTEVQLAELSERRWRAADARVIMEAHGRSGMSVPAFAREHGLNTKKIFWWRRRLSEAEKNKPSAAPLSFAPVIVTGTGGAAAVVVRSGEVEVEIIDPSRVDAAWLAEFLCAAGRS